MLLRLMRGSFATASAIVAPAMVATLVVATATQPATGQPLQMPGDVASSSPATSIQAEPLTGGALVADPAPGMPATAGTYYADGAMAGVPMSAQGGGAYYNPTLGAHLRATYSTRSYGQQEGVLTLGTMKLQPLRDGVAFLDGQVTMNDDSGVGYNLGIGYRWMSLPLLPYSPDDEKIMGISLWSDGQTVGGESFFNQVGLGFELLGERLDLRANGYLPVGPETRVRDFVTTGDTIYSGNFLAPELFGIEDTALSVGEIEVASRLGDLDAWAFAGVYGFSGGQYDATGGKLGVRGYATHDLLLSLSIANDDEFDTNAIFAATWFIGRTRAENCPTGVLTDRFREPVIRNNYVATQQATIRRAGALLTDGDDDAIRIVHVDSTAAGGGNGTFENPYNRLDAVNVVSGPEMEGDIILVHGGSTYTNDQIALLDNQRLLGEGTFNGSTIDHTVTLDDGSVFTLAETAAGAQSLAGPTVTNGAGLTAVTLADANEVNNFDITGGATGVGSGAFNTTGTSGAGDPTLANLAISTTTDSAIVLNSRVRIDPDTNDQSVEFNVDIDNIVLTDIGDAASDYGILINGEDNGFSDGASVALNEGIAINDVTMTGGAAVGIGVLNTNGSATTIANYTYDGGNTAAGALEVNNAEGAVTMSDSSLTGGIVGGNGINVINSAAAVTINDTVTINDVAGTVVNVQGDAGGSVTEGDVTVNADITNAEGLVARVTGLADDATQVTFNGTISSGDAAAASEADAGGILVTNNSGGSVTFNDDVTLRMEGTNGGVLLTNNDGATVSFAAGSELDIQTTTGTAFSATGGGDVTVANANSSITTAGGVGLELNGVNAAGAGITFGDFTVDGTSSIANAATLNNVTGATVQIGNGATAGAAGTIRDTMNDAIAITNAQSVVVDGLAITNAGERGIDITQNDSGTESMSVTVTDTSIVGSASDGIRVLEPVGAESSDIFNVAIADTTIDGGVNGVRIENYDGGTGTVSVSNVDIGATTSTSGTAFLADGDGQLNVTGTTVATTTSRAIDIQGMEIGGSGAVFDSVNVTNGNQEAIFLSDLTGNAVSINGGTLTTDTLAISATNVAGLNATGVTLAGTGDQKVSLTNNDANVMTVNFDAVDSANGRITVSHTGTNAMTFNYDDSTLVAANAASTDAVLDITANGSGAFSFRALGLDVTSNDVDSAAFALAIGNQQTSADITIREGAAGEVSQFVGAGVTPFTVGVQTPGAVRFELDSTTLNDTTTGVAAGTLAMSGTGTFNATVSNNTFTGAANTFLVNGTGGTTNLDLAMNGGGGATVVLDQANPGIFNTVGNEAAVQANNTATIDFTIGDTFGTTPSVPQPNN